MALTEFGQERHDWHAGLAREDDDLAAPCLEGLTAVGRGLRRDGDEDGNFMCCLHEPAIQRQQRLAVENDPGRGSGAGWPRGELGIVGQHCSDPHQDRVHPAPELVDEGAGTGRGDPLAVTRGDSGLAVKRHRPLGRDIGEAGGNAFQVRRIELGRRASLEPEIDREPRPNGGSPGRHRPRGEKDHGLRRRLSQPRPGGSRRYREASCRGGSTVRASRRALHPGRPPRHFEGP